MFLMSIIDPVHPPRENRPSHTVRSWEQRGKKNTCCFINAHSWWSLACDLRLTGKKPEATEQRNSELLADRRAFSVGRPMTVVKKSPKSFSRRLPFRVAVFFFVWSTCLHFHPHHCSFFPRSKQVFLRLGRLVKQLTKLTSGRLPDTL